MNAPHRDDGFFTQSLAERDAELFAAITGELGRQRDEGATAGFTWTTSLPFSGDSSR